MIHRCEIAVTAAVVVLLIRGMAFGQILQKNEYQREKEYAGKLEPTPIVAARVRTGAVQTLRIRFYADAEYRSGGTHWQERMRGQLAALNRIVEPSFAVRFEAESFHTWDHAGARGALAPMIDELEKRDPGLDVDWVIGLVAALPLVSMSFHDLGWARVLGRHFVQRSMTSVAEMQAFEQAFRSLDRADREHFYGVRKAHKETAIFLHEWAHTLGAVHVDATNRIMNGMYSFRGSLISDSDAGVISAGLTARLAAREQGSAAIDWSPVREALNKTDDPDWRRDDQMAILANLRGSSGPAATADPRQVARQAEPVSGPDARVLDDPRAEKADELRTRRRLGIPSGGTAFVLRREDEQAYADAFNGVSALIVDNKLKDAQKNLDTALKRFPGAPGLLTSSCELDLRAGRLRQAIKRCTDSLAVMEDQPRAHYLLGCIQAELGQPDRAIASLKRAIDLDGGERNYWESLAAEYRGLGRRREFTQFTIEYESRAPKP